MLWWRPSATYQRALGASFKQARRVHANAAAQYILFCTPRYTTSLFGLRVKEHRKRQFVHILLPDAVDFAHALEHSGNPMCDGGFEFAKLKVVKGNDVHRVLLIRPIGQEFAKEHLAGCLLHGLSEAPAIDLDSWVLQVSRYQLVQAAQDAQQPASSHMGKGKARSSLAEAPSLATTSHSSRTSALGCGLHVTCQAC